MPYVVKKSGSGYKVFKKGTQKSFSKKPLTKKKAEAQQKALYASEQMDEALDTKQVGSALEFKSVIPTIDKTEVTVFYKIKKDPGSDLALVYTLGETPEDADYLHGAIIDRHDPKGRPKKFEDPSAEETVEMLKVYKLTSEDVEMAGQDAYEKIEQHMIEVPALKEPYEESFEFEALCSKILSE